MEASIEEIRNRALVELEAIRDESALDSWRVRYLGKKSDLTQVLRSLSNLTIEQRKALGAQANEVKGQLTEHFRLREEGLKQQGLAMAASQSGIDITLPGRRPALGHYHPIMQTLDEMCDIFKSMGFQIMEGPEVETEDFNFEALNIPPEHPARDNMASLWVDHHTPDGKRPLADAYPHYLCYRPYPANP